MRKVTRLVPMLLTFVLTLAVGVALATPTPKASTNNATTKTTAKSKPSASQNRAKSEASPAATKKMRHVLASAEDLSGTIAMVDPSDKEVTLIGSNGVPYDFKLTKETAVELSNQKIGIKELNSESHKQATVHFVPRTDGNLAENIKIKTS